jgi:hypothetical protein
VNNSVEADMWNWSRSKINVQLPQGPCRTLTKSQNALMISLPQRRQLNWPTKITMEGKYMNALNDGAFILQINTVITLTIMSTI